MVDLSAYVEDFAPDIVEHEGSVSLRQTESQAFNRLDQYEKKALDDQRRDVDDALTRVGGFFIGDPDEDPYKAVHQVGVAAAPESIDPADADQDITFDVASNAELDRTNPAFATLTIGTGNAQVVFTPRHPGNGTPSFPMGNRMIMVWDATEDDQALSFHSDIVNIDGHNYWVFVVRLQTVGGVIQTTAQEIIDRCTFGHVVEDGDFSTLLSADAGSGDGSAVVSATDAPEQFADGEGGLYFAMAGPGPARVVSWDAEHYQVTLNFDGTAYPAGAVLNVGFVIGGLLAWISMPAGVIVAGGGIEVENQDGSFWIGPRDCEGVTGAWTIAYDADELHRFLCTRTPNDSSDTAVFPAELEQRNTADKGKEITGFVIYYAIDTAPLAVDFDVDVYVVPGALAPSPGIAKTWAADHDTAAERRAGGDHEAEAMFALPQYMADGDSLIFEVTADDTGGGAAEVIIAGIKLLFDTSEDF